VKFLSDKHQEPEQIVMASKDDQVFGLISQKEQTKPPKMAQLGFSRSKDETAHKRWVYLIIFMALDRNLNKMTNCSPEPDSFPSRIVL
jgi:hypothetical protein